MQQEYLRSFANLKIPLRPLRLCAFALKNRTTKLTRFNVKYRTHF